jgi:hypothetical protein
MFYSGHNNVVFILALFLFLAKCSRVSPSPSMAGSLAFDDAKSWSPNEPMSGDDVDIEMKVCRVLGANNLFFSSHNAATVSGL